MTEKKNTAEEKAPLVIFENLEGWLRGKIQQYVQDILEEEVRALLGRNKSERRSNGSIDEAAV